jgi:hypothetical protein
MVGGECEGILYAQKAYAGQVGRVGRVGCKYTAYIEITRPGDGDVSILYIRGGCLEENWINKRTSSQICAYSCKYINKQFEKLRSYFSGSF